MNKMDCIYNFYVNRRDYSVVVDLFILCLQFYTKLGSYSFLWLEKIRQLKLICKIIFKYSSYLILNVSLSILMKIVSIGYNMVPLTILVLL